MKNIILLLAIAIPLLLPAQTHYFPKVVPEKHQLPGVVAFDNQFLYMSETELTNKEYQEYLDWLKLNGKKGEYEKALWDTAGWQNDLSYNEPYVKYYHNHDAYKDYPAVNISQQQARNYCLWKRDRIMEYLKSKNSPIDNIIVRLPTEKEWIMAARKGLPSNSIYPWPEQGLRRPNNDKKCKGCILANVNMGGQYVIAGKLNDNGFITTPVKSFWPNKIGLWNMSGNVAEWVAESGKTKGGSWQLPPYHSRIDVEGFYNGDSSSRSDIGFRYVIEIVSVKNAKPLEPLVSSDKYYRGKFARINNSLYAHQTELTNKEYLQFLLENPDPSLKINNDAWKRYFPYAHYQMYGWHEAYYLRPVVNITYEAAVKYCEWLTAKYNATPGRSFEEVVFRLPTHDEWELAARGGRDGSMYPWGGPYVRNSHGCYLANFAPQEDQYKAKNDSGKIVYIYPENDASVSWGKDGLLIPGSVYSYFPNHYGLYHCAGNVAEMVSDKGHCRGGSWLSDQYYIQNATRSTYTAPGPDLGFRVFMEILER